MSPNILTMNTLMYTMRLGVGVEDLVYLISVHLRRFVFKVSLIHLWEASGRQYYFPFTILSILFKQKMSKEIKQVITTLFLEKHVV